MLPSLKKRIPYHTLTLPSNGKQIKYRPYINADKEALLIAKTSEDEDQIIDVIEQIVPICVHESTPIDMKTLPYFDLEYLFLHIIGKSDGETFSFVVRCNDDTGYDVDGNVVREGTPVSASVFLGDIKIKTFPNHEKKIHIVDDIYVILKYPTISLLQSYKKKTKEKQQITENDYIIDCTEFVIDGDEVTDSNEVTREELSEFYSGLTTKNKKDIVKFFETMPKFSHDISVTNPNTGVVTTVTVEGVTDFF